MDTETLLDDFAIRCFRDVADHDYITARLAYRSALFSQFQWSSLQAVEKYLKAILLLNRVKAKHINHDLSAAMKLCKKLPFDIELSELSEKFIEHLDTYGRFRYFETPYHVRGPKLVELDRTVWEIRRYCKPINYVLRKKGRAPREMLPIELKLIDASNNNPPTKYKISGGQLEKIIASKNHRARQALVWKNMYFASKSRKYVTMTIPVHGANSPLAMHPEILEHVCEYVHLPKDVINAYKRA